MMEEDKLKKLKATIGWVMVSRDPETVMRMAPEEILARTKDVRDLGVPEEDAVLYLKDDKFRNSLTHTSPVSHVVSKV